MTAIIIPFGAKIARFAELTPKTQQALIKMIDSIYKQRAVMGVSLDQFRSDVVELLETGEAYVEQGPEGIAIKLKGQG